LAQVYGRFFLRSGKFPRTFENLVAPPTNGNMKRLVRCKEYPVPKRRLKVRQNRSIMGGAIVHQTGKKMTKNAIQNLAVCCGAI